MQIVISSQAVIHEADPDLIKLIKRTIAAEEELPLLRVINPEYVNMVRFGSKFGSKPPKWWNGYYENKYDNTFIVPRAWMQLVMNATEFDWSDVSYDIAGVTTKYPEPKLKPLVHQESAMDAFFALVNHNDEHDEPTDSCIVLNTSAGKTILGMFIAYHSDERTMVVVPTKEIEEGWLSDACELFGCDREEIGQIRGKTIRIGEYLTVGSVQTLMKLDPELWADEFGLLILDELHGMAGRCFSKVLEMSKASMRLGLTATDNRKDGLMPVVRWHLGSNCYKDMTPMNCTDLTYIGVLYKNVITNIPNRLMLDKPKMKSREAAYLKKYMAQELLKRNYSTQNKDEVKEIKKDFITFYAGFKLPDLTKKAKDSEYQQLIHNITSDRSYNDFLVDLCAYIIDNYDGDILISSISLDHIKLLSKRIEKELEVPTAMLVGDPSNKRIKLYQDIKAGKFKVTVGTQRIVSQGASNPRWAHVIIATPFSNEELAIQIKGRPIRLDRNDPSKTMGYVWDVVTTYDNMAKSMGRTRFRAIEPYKQHIEWLDHSQIQGALNGS